MAPFVQTLSRALPSPIHLDLAAEIMLNASEMNGQQDNNSHDSSGSKRKATGKGGRKGGPKRARKRADKGGRQGPIDVMRQLVRILLAVRSRLDKPLFTALITANHHHQLPLLIAPPPTSPQPALPDHPFFLIPRCRSCRSRLTYCMVST